MHFFYTFDAYGSFYHFIYNIPGEYFKSFRFIIISVIIYVGYMPIFMASFTSKLKCDISWHYDNFNLIIINNYGYFWMTIAISINMTSCIA